MTSFLITCSNATCAVPEANRELFKGSEDRVTSTEGWEPGSLNLAQGLAMKFSTPLIHGDVTRLLINLDEEGDSLWSTISEKLPEPNRQKLIDRHLMKFRQAIESRVNEDLKRHDLILHLIIHTAPIADGAIIFEHAGASQAGIYAEKIVTQLPAKEIQVTCRKLSDKTPFISWLLESFPNEKYGLIRITVSQSFFMKSVPMRWETIKKSLIKAIHDSRDPG
ncbi:hypothetical protein ACFSSA_07490 [Luteolibacter algae]|uniref:Uncharacterized protein n=1 Tax=Luteolibacter algae TaxID=454151 RepID=A0ABW5D611_9BACT